MGRENHEGHEAHEGGNRSQAGPASDRAREGAGSKECDPASLPGDGVFRPALSVKSVCSVVQSSFEIRRNKPKLRPQVAGLKPFGVFPEACRPDERTQILPAEQPFRASLHLAVVPPARIVPRPALLFLESGVEWEGMRGESGFPSGRESVARAGGLGGASHGPGSRVGLEGRHAGRRRHGRVERGRSVPRTRRNAASPRLTGPPTSSTRRPRAR